MPRSAARGLGRGLGRIAFTVARRQRRRALAHLARARPDLTSAEAVVVASDAFSWIGRAVLDLRLAEARGVSYVLEPLRVEGEEHWRTATRDGRGVLACTAHCGNWELLGAAIARRGRAVSVLVRAPREVRLAQRLDRLRRSFGLTPLSLDAGFLTAVRALRRGEVLGVLFDAPARGRSLPCRFLGGSRPFALGAARLAALGDASILPMALWGGEDGGYRLRFFEPFEAAGVRESRGAHDLRDSHDSHDSRGRRVQGDVVECTARLAATLEEMVAAVPAQWPWFEDPWPDSAPRGDR